MSIEANIVDPDQTALFVVEASPILVDDKIIHFVIMCIQG